MLRSTFITISICLLLSSYSLLAQGQIGVRGVITFVKDEAPLSFGAIALYTEGSEEPVTGAITLEDGSFLFSGLKPGDYTIEVNSIESEPFRSEVITIDSRVVDVELRVKRAIKSIDEVTVAAKQKQHLNRVDKQILTAEANRTAAGGTAVDILTASPSIAIDLEGGVSLRGSSSFTVLINGRPALGEGSDALQQIPAETIDNIEVITNPSAKYSAEGTSGVINVITKKSSDQKASSYISLVGSSAESWKSSILVNINGDRVKHHFGVDLVNDRRRSDFDQDKSTIVDDIEYIADSEGPRVGYYDAYVARYGLDIALTESSSLLFDIEGAPTSRGYWGDLIYDETQIDLITKDTLLESSYTSYDRKKMDVDYVAGTAAFNHIFNKSSSLDASLYIRYGDCLEYFENRKRDIITDELSAGQNSWEDEFRWTIQGDMDYTASIGSGNLELGYQFYSYLEDGFYSMEQYSIDDMEFTPRPEFSSDFKFKRNINSIYSIYSNSLYSLEYQVGLRGEHTNRFIAGKGDVPDNREKRFDLFPSVHLLYNIGGDDTDSGKSSELLASYSRRTVRPRLHYMEPYITFADSYTARTGNPAVRPEYIDNIELGYKHNFNHSDVAGVTLFYRAKKDKIERIRTVYDANITLDSISNVGNDYSMGSELYANISLSKWWDLNLNGSMFFYRIESDYNFEDLDSESFNWHLTASNSFVLWQDGVAQLDARYVGPSVSTQGTRDSYFYTILAVQQKLFNRRMVATLKFNDLLSTAQYSDRQFAVDMNTVTNIDPQSPLVILSLSYHINNFKGKSSKGGTSDDIFEGAGY